MAVNLTRTVAAVISDNTRVDKGPMRDLLNEIIAAINGLDPLVTPSFASRAAAEAGAPALAAAITQILVREGEYLVERSRTSTADDPLFETAPRWGVAARYMSQATARRMARYGDVVRLANVAGTGAAITAEIPASHEGVTVDGLVAWRMPATNAGAFSLALGGTTYGVKTARGADFEAGALNATVDVIGHIRGGTPATIRLVGVYSAGDLPETNARKVMTAQERIDLTALRGALASLQAAPAYAEGYVLVFNPATQAFEARPADDIGGNMQLNWYDESTVVGTAPVTLLGSDPDMRRITLQNLSETASIAVAFADGSPLIGGAGITLGPGAILSDDNMPRGAVRIVADAAGVPVTCYVGSKGASPNWLLRANQLIYRHSNPGGLPAPFLSAMRDLYRRLDATGILSRALYFNVLAAFDAEFAAMDWSRRAGTLSVIGSPAYSGYSGWTLNGTSQRLMTGRRWSDDSVLSPTNAAMMVWADTTLNGIGKFAISSGDSGVEANRSATSHGGKIANTSYDALSGYAPGGMLAVQRVEAARATFRRNADAPRDMVRAVNANLSTYEHLIGATQTSTGPTTAGHWAGTPKFAYAGPALSDEAWVAVHSACDQYLTAIGGL